MEKHKNLAEITKPEAVGALPIKVKIDTQRVSILGKRLINVGLVTVPQLQKAIEYQNEYGGLLGNALTYLGILTQEQLNTFFMQNHKSLTGEQMIRTGLLTDTQLVEALNYREENGGRLENIITALGFVTSEQAEEFLRTNKPKSELKLGDNLVAEGVVTKVQLQAALELQRTSGGKLGDILLGLGYLTDKQLSDNLATQMDIGRAGQKVDLSNSGKLPYEAALKYNTVIIDTRKDTYIIAVREILNEEQLAEIRSYLDKPIEQVLATSEEFDNYWEAVYQTDELEESIFSLFNRQPENSARTTLSFGQKITGIVLIAIVVIFLICDAITTLLVLAIIAQVVYAFMSIFKVWILSRGHKQKNQMRFTPKQVADVNDRDLPVYSILIPVYKEVEIVPLIVERMNKLDYPKHKLDIRILLEEDDPETLDAFQKFDLPPSYALIVVPDSEPHTKPKACNYGLIRARGDYVVIYDAEDMPEPDQLKKVYLAFKELPEEYVCIQAKLNYYNSTQNILTRWFTHEYSTWFDVLLVGLMKFCFPLPLGGTSNHFKTNVLRDVGAWDPFNVTEDADLGIRLDKHGHQTAVLDSYTFEEANSNLSNWIRQRSRWLKGYMQTWLVHMRKPIKFTKAIGFKGFIGFQAMMLGTPIIPLLNPFFWIMTLIWYMFRPPLIPMLFPGALFYIASAQLLVGIFVFIYSNLVVTYSVIRDGEEKGIMHLGYSIVFAGILIPVYWLLMSVGAYVALFQLITKPHYWEKTVHGLTSEVTHKPVLAHSKNINNK